MVKLINVILLSVYLLGGGETTGIDYQINNASLSLGDNGQEFW
jgi:hypothetical protein